MCFRFCEVLLSRSVTCGSSMMATARGDGLVVMLLFAGVQPTIRIGRWSRARVRLHFISVLILVIGLVGFGLVFFECDGDDLMVSEDFQADGGLGFYFFKDLESFLFAGDELVVDDLNDVVVFESYAFGGGDVFDVGELEALRIAVHEVGFDCGGA